MVEHLINGVPARLFVKVHEAGEVRVSGGVEYVWMPCWKCNGTAHYPSLQDYSYCWGCRTPTGASGGKWMTQAELAQRDHERELREARRDRKAAEHAAELPRKIAALVDAHPLLAELTYLPDFDGIFGDLRRTLESYGELSAKQVALAEKLIREGMDRAVEAERVAVERAAEAADRVNAHFGEVKERLVVTGKVRVQWEIDGDYGVRTLLVIDTPRGTVKWVASRCFPELRGSEITLRGTVKEHGTRDGEAQTMLTRCTVLD
jgi:muconolactone delta-isomerase